MGTILGLIFIYVFFWSIPSSIYKYSKTKLRAFIGIFLYCTIPLLFFFYVGITAQQGFIQGAKTEATKNTHVIIIQHIEDSLWWCRNINSREGSPLKISIDCSALNEVSTYQNVVKALNDAGYKNAYQTNTPAVIYSSSEPALGMTSIFYKDSKIYIRTKHSDDIDEKAININQ